jgi:hypothetical protein
VQDEADADRGHGVAAGPALFHGAVGDDLEVVRAMVEPPVQGVSSPLLFRLEEGCEKSTFPTLRVAGMVLLNEVG